MNDQPKPIDETLGGRLKRAYVRGPTPKTLAVAAVVSALLGAVPAFFSAPPASTPYEELALTQIEQLRAQIRQSQRVSDQLNRMLALTEVDKDEPTSKQYRALKSQADQLSARLTSLEKVILDTPAKALEVPLLRKDIDNNKQANTESLASMQHSVDRVYDQNKYVMLTIFASIVLLAISTFIKAGKKPEKD